jgi:type I restriction enzyme S subunit
LTLRIHPDEIVEKSHSPLLAIHPSWERVRLSEIADVLNGFAFKSAYFDRTDGVPLLRIRDVGRDDTATRYKGDFDSMYLVEPGDLVIGMDGDFRAARWSGPQALLNQRVCKVSVRVPELYDPHLLLYVLPGYLDAVHAHTSSVTVKHLSSRTVQDLPLPLPPLNEQRRIVAAIEEHLSRLDAADASLAAALRRLAPLREHLYRAATDNGAPTSPLRELLREPLRNGHSAKASGNGTVRTLTLSAVTRNQFTDDNTKLTGADPEKVKSLWLEPGDILVERSNTPELVGTAALYKGPRNWAIFPDLLIRVRVKDTMLPEYLEIVMKATPARRYFQRAAQGIAGSMPKIDQGVVERLEVPLPPLDEQRRIVAEVEERLSMIDAMRASIERAQRRSAALRAAILERAFRGELVPQDPADEPAEALLARIRAEREARAALSGRRKRA